MLHLNRFKPNFVYSNMLLARRTLMLLHENTVQQQPKSVQIALKTVEGIANRDPFKGLQIDFTALPLSEKLPSSILLNKVLGLIINSEKQKNTTHVFGLKTRSNNSDIIKTALKHGFRFHNANPTDALLNLCLENHDVKECSFPPHRTVSAGVTAVVFDRELNNVLVVMEKIGVIKKFKPPTGGVDYDDQGETPLDAVVRELKEEVGISVDPKHALFVGLGWTKNYRGPYPDLSSIFAFIVDNDKMEKINVQEREILKAQWIPFEEFMKEPAEEKEKPWLLRQAVLVAFEAIKNTDHAWKPQTLYLSTGKPVEFFSAHSPIAPAE